MTRKKGKIIAGAAAIMLVGAGGAWHVITGNILKNTASWVAQVGSKKLADGTSYTLTYDSMTRTRFPSIGVRLVNPSYTFIAPGDDTQTRPPINVSIKMNGVVDTTTDYLSNAYRVAINGAYAIDATVGEERITAMSASPSSEQLTLQARDRATFNAWNALDWNNSEQVKLALQGIAAARYEVGAFALNDAGGTLLVGGENVGFGFVNRGTEGHIDGNLHVKAKALESSAAYDQAAEKLLQALGTPLTLKLGEMPFSASRAGKQDIDVAISAKLPLGMASGKPPIGNVQVRKFYFKNDFYTFNAPTTMLLVEANGQRSLNLKLDWMLEATAAGGTEAQRFVNMVVGFMPQASEESPLDPELLKQKITAALPTFSTLGPITLAIDLDATSPIDAPAAGDAKAPAARDSVTLRNFAFSHKRWGLEAKGDTLNDANGATINLALTCKQCDTFTGDVVLTAQGAQEAMNVATPNRPQMALTPEFLANVNSTLAEIGSKAGDDITFTFTTPKAGEVVVNGKPLAEVGPKLMALFMALQPAPVAPPSEEAPAE